ncbi:MAG: hypothetical protein COW05_02815 [Gammaproteobacteria bacterium CG12_big_fil_rev_8_21_14_0_65_46_12]|nr:MAG: hypothetical protein COW05_02815 [Gammaproteobacteria bacterium CG12_big_fil_rev_8_21_14_0_65_46_12]PIR31793.1 MAG: hypothetical protein COV36_06800 [Alphaproteobacteria bacterium CG11_big_fil_rev_8_21_14_0_20_44_7]
MGTKVTEPIQELSQSEKDELIRAYTENARNLGKSLSAQGVKAIFLGDSNHDNSSIAANVSSTIKHFRPDLVFLEAGVDLKDALLNNPEAAAFPKGEKGTGISNQVYEIMGAMQAGAKVIAVDEPEYIKQQGRELDKQRLEVGKRLNKLDKSLNAAYDSGNQQAVKDISAEYIELQNEYNQLTKQVKDGLDNRISKDTNQFIVNNMADAIEDFYKENGRMPKIATFFGSDHIEKINDMDEMLLRELHKRDLPTGEYANHKEILYTANRETGEGTDVKKNFFGEFEYTLDAEAVCPKYIGDIRNPENFTRDQDGSPSK